MWWHFYTLRNGSPATNLAALYTPPNVASTEPPAIPRKTVFFDVPMVVEFA